MQFVELSRIEFPVLRTAGRPKAARPSAPGVVQVMESRDIHSPLGQQAGERFGRGGVAETILGRDIGPKKPDALSVGGGEMSVLHPHAPATARRGRVEPADIGRGARRRLHDGPDEPAGRG